MRFLFIFLFILAMSFSNIANAWTCATSKPTIIISPPNLTVLDSVPVDTAIGSPVTSTIANIYSCDNSDNLLKTYSFGIRAIGEYVKTIGGRKIYKTSVDGIGFAIGGTGSSCGLEGWVDGSNTMLGDTDTHSICTQNAQLPATFSLAGTAQVQFYKISNTVSSGTVSAQQVGGLALLTAMVLWYPEPQNTVSINSFNIIRPVCTVNTQTVNVQMGTVVKNQFNGIGTSLNDVKNVNISLNCPANTAVAVQVDGNILNAEKGLLNITSETLSATGVAIQLLYNNSPFTLGVPIQVGTAVTQGTFIIPLQARYYQSGQTVTPGSANSSATFTLTYK